MSDRSSKRPLLAAIAVAAIGVGAIAGWLLWWRPRQDRAEARAQVEAWEPRWAEARRCLIGDPPLASDPVAALALAELSTGSLSSNATDCTRVVGKLTRPEGGRSPIDAVERAWAGVEAAVPALAQAYAMRIGARPDEIDRRVVDLGVAITALDGAHDALRAAAGLPALDRGGRFTPVRLADPAPLEVAGEPVTASLATEIMAGTVRGEQPGQEVVSVAITGLAPDQVRAVRWPAGAVPALPDASWLVETEPARQRDPAAREDQVAVVAVTRAQHDQLEAGTLVAIADPPHVPVAALGAGATRAVVLVPEVPGPAPLRLAVSTDGGARWELRPAPEGAGPGEVVEARYDVIAGAVDLLVAPEPAADPDGDLIGELAAAAPLLYRLDAARPTEVPAPVAVEHFSFAGACRAGDTLWWSDEYAGVYRLAGGEVTRAEPPGNGDTRLADCTAGAALIEEGSMPVRYHRCGGGRCAEVFRGSTYAYGRAAMLPDGTVVYAAGRGPVIALWTEGVPDPVYFKLPRPMTLHAVVVWDGVPHALLRAPRDEDGALHAVALTGAGS